MQKKNVFVGEFEWVKSHLDDADSESDKGGGKPILLHGAPMLFGQFGYPAHPRIYPSSLVMLNPRWTAESYSNFYQTYYDDLYRLDLKPDYGHDGVVQHMQEVWSRVARHKVLSRDSELCILDAGSGPGYGLRWLASILPASEFKAIEASPDACRILKDEIGVDIIDSELDGAWLGQHQERFDVIIMRHVVEHMLDPITTLSEMSKTLNQGSFMYIAVPDMMHPRVKLRDYDNWWEYWFRAVHPYYYNKKTLFQTLHLAGLYPFAWGEENEEIWVLAGCGDQPFQDCFNIDYQVQDDLIQSLMP